MHTKHDLLNQLQTAMMGLDVVLNHEHLTPDDRAMLRLVADALERTTELVQQLPSAKSTLGKAG
jgi:hypothetical protein